MTALVAGMRLQLWRARRAPDDLLMLVTVPFFTVIFVSITVNAGRPDLLAHALVAPMMIGIWMFAVTLAGDIVDGDRWLGTLELEVASPARLGAVVLGRILAITGIALLAVAETWLIAWAVFGIVPEVGRPWAFVVTLAATCAAMAATSVVFAALFVLARSALYFKNVMGYPFYVLSGFMVPVAVLPDWVRPVSRALFLTWSAEALRESVAGGPLHGFAARIAVILLLGLAGGLAGHRLLERVLRRVRETGSMTYA